jgi:hypothetical protein
VTSTARPGDSPEAAFASRSSLERYRQHVLQRTNPQWHEWTARAMRKQRPELPIEMAEWQVHQMVQHRTTHEARLFRGFAGVKSLDELRELDAVELLARATIVGRARLEELVTGIASGRGDKGTGVAGALVISSTAADSVSATSLQPSAGPRKARAAKKLALQEPGRASRNWPGRPRTVGNPLASS